MLELSRILMIAGTALFVTGLVLSVAGRLSWFGRLPGDQHFNIGSVTVHAPFASMIVISILLTVILNLAIRWLR